MLVVLLRSLLSFFTCFAGLLSVAPAVLPEAHAEQNLTEAQVAIVVQRLADGAHHSWELGTREQTLIELDAPSFSVLNGTALPPPTSAPDSLSTVLDIIAQVVKHKTATLAAGQFCGPQALFPGQGSAADPASNGVAALIANWTGQSNSSIDLGRAAED